MKPIYILLACFLLPGVLKAQTSGANPDSSANDTNLAAEIKALREALLQTQKQMAAQQREIETLKAQSNDGATRTVTNQPAPRPNEIAAGDSATSSVESSTEYASTNIQQQPPTQRLQEQGKPEQVPLGSFKVGDAILELGGFVDLENIFRTTNTQSNIATNFGGFPYSNTPQGRVTEFRTTAQFCRLSFKIQDPFCRQRCSRLRGGRLQRQRCQLVPDSRSATRVQTTVAAHNPQASIIPQCPFQPLRCVTRPDHFPAIPSG
jgi:hypothetical protein